MGLSRLISKGSVAPTAWTCYEAACLERQFGLLRVGLHRWEAICLKHTLPLYKTGPGSAVCATPKRLPAHSSCLSYVEWHGTLSTPCSRAVLQHPGCEAAQLTDLRHGAQLLELKGRHGGCLALSLGQLVQLLCQVGALLLSHLHRGLLPGDFKQFVGAGLLLGAPQGAHSRAYVSARLACLSRFSPVIRPPSVSKKIKCTRCQEASCAKALLPCCSGISTGTAMQDCLLSLLCLCCVVQC